MKNDNPTSEREKKTKNQKQHKIYMLRIYFFLCYILILNGLTNTLFFFVLLSKNNLNKAHQKKYRKKR